MPYPARPSSWRQLFAGDDWPRWQDWPELLAPLREAFEVLGDRPEPESCKAWQPRLTQALLKLDLPAWRISQLLSDHNDWLYRQAIQASLEEMAGQGWGPPPCGFCVLSLGSGARHESLLGPDQDNAMIIDDYPDARHSAIDTWFQSLGERFTERLHDYGIPLCNGHVMARWPSWRKRRGEWLEQLRLWTGRRTVKLVQQSNILLDFMPVYGDVQLAHRLREQVLELMPRAGLFLHEMGELQDEAPVALDRFDRLRGNDKDAPHARALNLKRQGLLPLQGATRLMALVHRQEAVDTRSRLQALAELGVLDHDRARTLTSAMNRLQALLLQSQLDGVAAGRGPDNWIDLGTLDAPTRAALQHDLMAIRDLQRRARALVAGI
ncbi:MAG: signal transduction protein [Oceanospirillaceae bacterium]|nr:signal transduction protein [Oceanospirillaceae bacterium]